MDMRMTVGMGMRMGMRMGVGWNHLLVLYYNITIVQPTEVLRASTAATGALSEA
jgi:hypothetical protein